MGVIRVGIASDHGGFTLKEQVAQTMRDSGCEIVDFGAHSLVPGDDYPDFVVPLANAVARGEADRGIAICGSGIGACVAANKVPGVRAGLIHDVYSAHQGVEDDDMLLEPSDRRVVAYHESGHALVAWLTPMAIQCTK
jgi:ribose 5-phosphate isomerase B